MALVIVTILLIAYVLMATESVTNMNKAAVAIFAGTVGWVLYISYGANFVMSQYPAEYLSFLHGATPDSTNVKLYIAQNIFLKYVGRAAEVVLFLLSTMTIVEILDNNGCFDFISHLLRTRKSSRILWILATVSFVLSANLDNLTTTVMMLMMMRKLVSKRQHRFVLGAAIVISANCGGALTVIGSPSGLVLWNMGAVTATNYSLTLLIPCLLSWAVPVWLLGRMLPDRLDTEPMTMPYRGDDTRLNVYQRLMMLFVGIGGLWFIPSFHSITRLSPFLGALCVLSVLWTVNEIFNRNLVTTGDAIHRKLPRILQYGVIQMMLFVMGIMLAVGVVQETGVMNGLVSGIPLSFDRLWAYGAMAGVASMVIDNFAMALPLFSLHSVFVPEIGQTSSQVLLLFAENGDYWKVMSYVCAAFGNVLCIGSMSGLALVKMENMRVSWYLRNAGYKALLGALVGYAALWLILWLNLWQK